MRLLITTDAWRPQVNGVVTTLERLCEELPKAGVEVILLTPAHFKTLPMPGYPTIRLARATASRIAHHVDVHKPDWIHIATEGPIGWAARRLCVRRGIPFTSSYHTKFPEYVNRILGIPSSWIYRLVKSFHDKAAGVMVATPSLHADLEGRGFRNLMQWSRGVDLDVFHPRGERLLGHAPVFLYVGRVSREKNIEAFLEADLPGCKVVVGDGPYREHLERRFSDAVFTGAKSARDLPRFYDSADVFVFPSRTDTFGLVILEAMASGLPVAAYPVTGPIDIVEQGVSGILNDDLAVAARAALQLDPDAARARAAQFSWSHCAHQFLENIRTAGDRARAAAFDQNKEGSASGGPAHLLIDHLRTTDDSRRHP